MFGTAPDIQQVLDKLPAQEIPRPSQTAFTILFYKTTQILDLNEFVKINFWNIKKEMILLSSVYHQASDEDTKVARDDQEPWELSSPLWKKFKVHVCSYSYRNKNNSLDDNFSKSVIILKDTKVKVFWFLLYMLMLEHSVTWGPLRQDSSKLVSSQFLHLKLHYWWSALSLLLAWNTKITSMCKTLYNPALNQHSGSDVPPSADVGGWRLLKTQAWKGEATRQEIRKCAGNGWYYMADAKRLSIRHKSGQN